MKATLFVSSFFLTAVSAFTGRATFYSTGGLVGTCNEVIQDTDLIVALNTDQFTSTDCNKSVQITSGSKTITAVIKDSCPACGANNLDLTEALFEFFSPLDVGLIPITWNFV